MVEGDVLSSAMRGYQKNFYQEWHDSIYILRVLWVTWDLENGDFEAEEHRMFAQDGSWTAAGLENNSGGGEEDQGFPGKVGLHRKMWGGRVLCVCFRTQSHCAAQAGRNSRAWTSTSQVLGLQLHAPHLAGKVPHTLEHLKGKWGSGTSDKEGNKVNKEKMTMMLSRKTKNKEVVTVCM